MKTKSIAKHTPGPWSIQSRDKNNNTLKIQSDANLRFDGICDVNPMPSYDDRQEANARLISGAPELLTCLYELRDRLQMGQDASGNSSINQAEIDLINAAIAKAEGGN